MASLWDICTLLITSALVVGVILTIMLVARKYREAKDAFNASLDRRGWTLSSSPREAAANGGSVGTGAGAGSGGKVVVLKSKKNRMMDQEHYLDATQRGVMKAVQASTFGAPVKAANLNGHGGAGNHHTSSSVGEGMTNAIDGSAGTSSSSTDHRHPHLHQVRQYGHSLKGHVESWRGD